VIISSNQEVPMPHSKTQSSKDPPRNQHLHINEDIHETRSDVDPNNDNQRPGIYTITRSRLMSLYNRNWQNLELDLEQMEHDKVSCKYRLKYYIVISIFICIVTLISIGIKVLIQFGTDNNHQDEDGQFPVCFQSVEKNNSSNGPLFFCNCFQSSSKLDDTFWNIYSLVQSTRGITEHVSDDELVQVCSPANLAINWIAWEIRASLRRNEYVDFETIQTRFVLALLHIAWNGSQWKNHDGWLSNRTACEWHGIQCDNDSGVIKISLRQNKLQGILDSRLGLLRRLKVLDLVQNEISGSIPTELWSLSMLGEYQIFKVSSCFVFITANQTCTAKEDIQLGYNSITGTISFDLGLEATALRNVYLDFNPITGVLPNAGVWKNLTNLSISNTAISGTIPYEFGLLTQLERISLHRNPTLSGTLPLSLTYLSNLKVMDLGFVDLRGTIPESIGYMLCLRECLYLWLSVFFPSHVTQWIVP
jgi:hypothetical protein